MPDIRTLIRSAPLVLDGAWGTELHQLGLGPGACPDACNLTHPEWVVAVARSYIDAGSQIILTNTFGANRMVLARHGLAGSVGEINRTGAKLSLEAAAGRAHVVASMGPTGTLLSTGDVTTAELSAVFEEQATALAEGGAAAVVLETVADLQELGVALAAVRRAGLFAIACMVFDSGPGRDRTAVGTTPEQAVKYLS